jgi:hypothetical protein
MRLIPLLQQFNGFIIMLRADEMSNNEEQRFPTLALRSIAS